MSTPLILPDAEALAVTVATTLLTRLQSAQADGGDPHVCLTGGSIARSVHREVARRTPDSGVDWSRVHVWWGDERFVARDSEERNEKQARADLLDHLGPHGLDEAKVHPVPAVGEVHDVVAAAAAYGETLRSAGSGEFEVVMLGLGEDGHVASLFPASPLLAVDDAIAVAVTDSPKPPPERVSLTFDALNRARASWLVVSGEPKAAAVAAALGDAPVTLAPAAGVHGRLETTWYLDRAAASHLR